VAELTVYEKPTCTTCRKLAADPVLLERPVIERGDRAVLGRPPERALELLD
jgi:arsenate reductase-like glutaredoxin family protein